MPFPFLKSCMEMACPSLKCWRTLYAYELTVHELRSAFASNFLYTRLLQGFAYKISQFFWGWYARITVAGEATRSCSAAHSHAASPCAARAQALRVLGVGPRHQFPLGSSAVPLFLLYEATTVMNVPWTALWWCFQKKAMGVIQRRLTRLRCRRHWMLVSRAHVADESSMPIASPFISEVADLNLPLRKNGVICQRGGKPRGSGGLALQTCPV